MPKTVTLSYQADPENHAGTGFSLSQIIRMGVWEAPPAIMQYEAAKIHASYVARGDRSAALKKRLNNLAISARRARMVLAADPQLAAIYSKRTTFRDAGRPVADWPALPAKPTGKRARQALLGNGIAQPRCRPRKPWFTQTRDDLEVLRELGHAIPVSQRPTQTYFTEFKVEKGVPLERRVHSALSCAGCECCI